MNTKKRARSASPEEKSGIGSPPSKRFKDGDKVKSSSVQSDPAASTAVAEPPSEHAAPPSQAVEVKSEAPSAHKETAPKACAQTPTNADHDPGLKHAEEQTDAEYDRKYGVFLSNVAKINREKEGTPVRSLQKPWDFGGPSAFPSAPFPPTEQETTKITSATPNVDRDGTARVIAVLPDGRRVLPPLTRQEYDAQYQSHMDIFEPVNRRLEPWQPKREASKFQPRPLTALERDELQAAFTSVGFDRAPGYQEAIIFRIGQKVRGKEEPKLRDPRMEAIAEAAALDIKLKDLDDREERLQAEMAQSSAKRVASAIRASNDGRLGLANEYSAGDLSGMIGQTPAGPRMGIFSATMGKKDAITGTAHGSLSTAPHAGDVSKKNATATKGTPKTRVPEKGAGIPNQEPEDTPTPAPKARTSRKQKRASQESEGTVYAGDSTVDTTHAKRNPIPSADTEAATQPSEAATSKVKTRSKRKAADANLEPAEVVTKVRRTTKVPLPPHLRPKASPKAKAPPKPRRTTKVEKPKGQKAKECRTVALGHTTDD